MKLSTAIAVSMATFSTLSVAQTERDLDSHEHGAASLNIAIDGDLVYLEVETPWNNVVGFEHAPRTDSQHALMDDALAILNQPRQLFSFIGSDCAVSETLVESGMGDEGGHDKEHDDDHAEGHDKEHDDDHAEGHDKEHDDDHAEGHDKEHDDDHAEGHDKEHDDDHAEGHDKEHDDDHQEDHDEDHEGHSEEAGVHSSLLVTYTFDCNNASKLEAIDVTLLDVWSGFEDLDVQLIGPGGQALIELNQQQHRVDLTQVQ